jgi:glyceraldehyde-3-phosphate dehydrogenase (NADP+)
MKTAVAPQLPIHTGNNPQTSIARSQQVLSPILGSDGNRTYLGEVPLMNRDDALAALNKAVESYDYGTGEWARASLETRASAVRKFNDYLSENREKIADLLMWEICKTKSDALKEVDRTIEYMEKTIDSALAPHQDKRASLGVMLLMGPSNYPINETLTVMLPSLLMGNSVIIKTPKVGALAVLALEEGFKKCFPEGVVSMLSGDGQELITPIVESGKLNALCFIGGTNTAKRILGNNPNPHKLKVVLGLGAKNPGIILPDADLEKTASECVKGALSFNGQRCTALKALFVHTAVAEQFSKLMKKEVEKLQCGNPWEEGVTITPIEPSSVEFMETLVNDAIATSGATVINNNGGTSEGNLYTPAVLYPVTVDSRIAHEEQFGPVVPIIPFDDESEVIEWMKHSNFAQQVSIFTTNKAGHEELVNAAKNIYSRINFNTQCQRSPDDLPFTGSRDSGMGVLSIKDALLEFSRPVVVQGE